MEKSPKSTEELADVSKKLTRDRTFGPSKLIWLLIRFTQEDDALLVPSSNLVRIDVLKVSGWVT